MSEQQKPVRAVTDMPPGTKFKAHYIYEPTTFVWDGKTLRNRRGHAEYIEDVDQATIHDVISPEEAS